MRSTCFVFMTLGLMARAEIDLDRTIPEVRLKDGRVLHQVEIVGYSEHVVMARWDDNRGTLAYQDLPAELVNAIEKGHLRPLPKPKPIEPLPPPAPVPPPKPARTTTLVSDLKPGTTMVLHGRRQGSQLFLRVTIEAEGHEYLCECLVDTGATYTTVAKAQVPIAPTGKHEFTTANGQVLMPFATAAVTVGEITKEISVALSPNLRVNLLGANFFEDFVYTIDLENSAIYLLKR